MGAPLAAWIAANDERVHVASAVDPASDKSSAACGDADRTIYATSGIAEGDVVVRLHDGAFLNGSTWLRGVEAAMTADKATELKNELATLQPSGTVLTALGLLAEKARGESSAFRGYIEQLPTKVPLPLAWDAPSRALLKDTAAHPIIDDGLVRSVFDRFAQPLASKFSGLWAKSGISFEGFRWAFSIVSSRAFSIDGSHEPTLLPVIDMANHDPTDPSAVIRKDDDDGYSLVALRAITADTAVTISYGELSNAQLLCRYGFTLADAAASDSILVSSAHVRAVFAQLTSGGSVDGALAQLEYLTREEPEAHVHGTAEVGHSDDGDSAPAVKRRKLFAAQEPAVDDALTFALHGDAAQEFGLADGLMGFVFANDLPMDALYDVLTVLLQNKDRVYSALLAREAASDEAQLARALVGHERQACRRILLGITSLEEDSDDDGDGGDDAEEDEDEEEEE